MCFFPLPNPDINGLAYKKGVTTFDCGSCPECLRKRANVWALRAVYESREHAFNCMITLTYDSYIYDSHGRVIGERVSDFSVCKRDIQLFIKRLRKWYSSVSDEKIKYLACAEYGKRTHRAHYHCLLFGVRFPDLVFYKRSKRGNVIYKSHKLDELWKNGICTVDSVNVGSAVARYCTKYCAKDRSDDTFMLFSQDIGLKGLLRDFNGKSYFIEGREFPIPRVVWESVISSRHYGAVSNRYINRNEQSMLDGSYARNVDDRRMYRAVRDSDPQYIAYLQYWHDKSFSFDKLSMSVEQRIALLDDTKYHNYKVEALRCLSVRCKGIPCPAPKSGSRSAYAHYFLERFGIQIFKEDTCRIASRPYTASDTDICNYPRPMITARDLVLRSKNFKVFLSHSLDFDPFM